MGLESPVHVHRTFCRVSGVVDPAIHFEVRMPLENWNGRFRGFGLGAFWGALPYNGMAQALDKGYAVGGTDTGHQSAWDDGTWAMSGGAFNSGIVGDWAHRGIHEMTLKSQAIVEKLYGRRAHHSYFAGCSSGGYQALTEAQRYPADYDGILAGAPANYLTHLQAAQLSFGWRRMWIRRPASRSRSTNFPCFTKRCSTRVTRRNGVKDGLIENPAACRSIPPCSRARGTTRRTV